MEQLVLLLQHWDLFVRIWSAGMAHHELDPAHSPVAIGDGDDDDESREGLIFLPAFISVGACFVIAVIYVASLYVWNSKHDR